MKIAYKDVPTAIRFDDAEVGDIFEFEKDFYLKVSDSKSNNSFNIATNTLESFECYDCIYLHDAELCILN